MPLRRWARGRRRWQATAPLLVFGLAAAVGLVLILRPGESRFEPVERADPVLDLLGWAPATDQSLREYAAWAAQPGDPSSLAEAIDRLGIVPGPLALGRSAEWQRATGISASRITGWASAPGANITILTGEFAATEIEARLGESGYSKSTYLSVPIWRHPTPATRGRIVDGDDLRALNAIAIYQRRVILGTSEEAVRRSLDAANGDIPSLASDELMAIASAASELSGVMVLDQRDLAIDCGVGGQWLKDDFDEPSGGAVAILYHKDKASTPVTSVWLEYADELAAEVALPVLDSDWRTGYVNRTGFGGLVANLAAVQSVTRRDAYVVADLTASRDNGWVRSGVRYLIAICEQSSSLIPAGDPNRATPIVSPSPMEAP